MFVPRELEKDNFLFLILALLVIISAILSQVLSISHTFPSCFCYPHKLRFQSIWHYKNTYPLTQTQLCHYSLTSLFLLIFLGPPSSNLPSYSQTIQLFFSPSLLDNWTSLLFQFKPVFHIQFHSPKNTLLFPKFTWNQGNANNYNIYKTVQ